MLPDARVAATVAGPGLAVVTSRMSELRATVVKTVNPPTARLRWSNEDQLFVAEAPELPGCMAHGDDQETALRNIKDAMQFWTDRARELGRPVPEPSFANSIRRGTPTALGQTP